ncbi:MAG TPA: hypothetical protein VFG33_26270 [Kribbella sp.]|uniref:hypothetical protein n=1 Tax=Kribbella sp. TaxID=1871183 RepID=UPI002D76851F|nr:hypothetical protein [Kribbella sp.]HET6296920.1 hypothetical protein [Kribbella sp.]
MTARRAVYEIRIDAGEGDDEALAMQEPLARVVCPDPGHAPPCDVPWGFSMTDDELVMGLYSTNDAAQAIADRVRDLLGARRVEVVLGSGDQFAGLVEQYNVEHRP